MVNQRHLSFTDAAERVLNDLGHEEPMHYREITQKALALGLITTGGKTPEATLNAAVFNEIKRQSERGEEPRFTRPNRGLIGLSRWQPRGLVHQVSEQNRASRDELLARVRELSPGEFEALVGRLLSALGFEEVAVTSLHTDGGIDVRGTLVVGEAVRTKVAVQVKRWQQNVQAPAVQQVRGALGAHEQGLIITTSGFSPGAREESERPDAVPVSLMDGKQLAAVLAEHRIGARATALELIEVDEDDLRGETEPA
jgi:restriction system protein